MAELIPLATGTGAASARLGVPDPAKPLLIAALAQRAPGPVLVMTSTPARSRALAEEIPLFASNTSVVRLPEEERLPYEFARDDPVVSQERVSALSALSRADRTVIVSSWSAVALHCAPPSAAQDARRLGVGEETDPSELSTWLEAAGYRSEPYADRPASFARHGGIVDVFLATGELAVRIEFDGNLVETLRRIDVETQRSAGRIPECTIPAASTSTQQARRAADDLATSLEASGEDAEYVLEQLQLIAEGGRSGYAGFFEPLLFPVTALTHAHPEAVLVVDEEDEGEESLRAALEQNTRAHGELEERGAIPRGLPETHSPPELLRKQIAERSRTVRLHRFGVEELGSERLPLGIPPAFAGRLQALVSAAASWADEGKTVVICSQQSLRIAELLLADGIKHELIRVVGEPPAESTLSLAPIALSAGFTAGESLVVISDAEIFGFRKRRRPTRSPRGAKVELVASVSPGDYLVHTDHGIARFAGVVRRSIDNAEREYLELQYAEGDKLYVPADQLESVTRYVGPTDHPPSLTRLGSGEWVRARRRVRQAVAEMAHDLLDLYAKRELAKGYQFPTDSAWQMEMEAAFPFIETSDQLAAIREVKSDMERGRPMDRLICGDVGYGKTEVAVRAAFKAVMNGKQVAVLVPTTVLAEQHGSTFRERTAGFPVKVSVLSRFRSDKEQREIVEAIESGEADIVIGTHRLLGKDVKFHDLGLVVVDEEQRFGVAHKERLKQMREEVDVLTLSATPIPRTLQMALSGVRDMSTVMTPPEERLPIRTYVTGWDDEIVHEAITRELQRGGQVYFVHNRVHSIERVLARLREVVPEAAFTVGHGQMPEEQLERVMLEFAAGEYDVLLCTTIIESGLDMPNVNTILIDNANQLGLAQLYQLRGRVGRASNRAFAYLLYDPDRAITEQAQRRLEAIFEATELGAGFQIALRDLEIRGAGNLLGTQQSGYIAAVGLELYTRLLGEAVAALRAALGIDTGEEAAVRPPPVTIDLPVSAHIPPTYIGNLNLRLATYQRITDLSTAESIGEMQEELTDRFGVIPPAVESLLFVALVRIMSREGGVTSITTDPDILHVTVRSGISAAQRTAVGRLGMDGIRIGPEQVRIDRGLHDADWMPMLVRILKSLGEANQDPVETDAETVAPSV